MTDSENSKSTRTPCESSVIAAYKVTANSLIYEGQLIWRRTSIFIALNALVAAGLHYIGDIPDIVVFLVSLAGLAYCICWNFSMARCWHYYIFHIALMREQESELNLNQLGTYSRGLPISKGNSDTVSGEEIKFGPTSMLFSAKTMNKLTTWIFFIVYTTFIIKFIFYGT